MLQTTFHHSFRSLRDPRMERRKLHNLMNVTPIMTFRENEQQKRDKHAAAKYETYLKTQKNGYLCTPIKRLADDKKTR